MRLRGRVHPLQRAALRLPDRAARVDAEHGVFVQCVDELDEALLLLPSIGFVEFDDERRAAPSERYTKSSALRASAVAMTRVCNVARWEERVSSPRDDQSP
jgi:hypothetical protein